MIPNSHIPVSLNVISRNLLPSGLYICHTKDDDPDSKHGYDQCEEIYTFVVFTTHTAD